MARMSLRKDVRSDTEVSQAAEDAELEKSLPWLLAFLTQVWWDKGDPRETGTIMVLAEEGKWKCWVHDRDAERSAWVSADTMLQLFQRVNEGLSGKGLGWRADGAKGGKKGR